MPSTMEQTWEASQLTAVLYGLAKSSLMPLTLRSRLGPTRTSHRGRNTEKTNSCFLRSLCSDLCVLCTSGAMIGPLRLSRSLFPALDLGRFFLLSQSRALQNILHRVIPFVTSVFINGSDRGRPTVLAGPRLGPGCGVVDREAIQKGLIVHAREALDHVQVLGRSAEPRLVREIRGVHHEGVAFPVPHGVSQPQADGFRKMLTVHAHDSGVMHHFCHNHD